jgi:hypothetical protein
MGIAKEHTEAMKAQFGRGGGGRSEGRRSDSVSSAPITSPSTMPSSTSYFFVPRTTSGAQPYIRSIVKTKEKQKVDKLAS